MKGLVFLSRYTPGLANATDVGLRIGDDVLAKAQSGAIVSVKIDSELMSGKPGDYGYECLTIGDMPGWPDGTRCFVPEQNIIGWEGKVS